MPSSAVRPPRPGGAGRVPPAARGAVPLAPPGEAAARRELRRQVADLERRLSDAALSAFPHGAVAPAVPPAAAGPRRRPAPRVLGLAELEALRDELAGRLHGAEARLGELGARQERARERLERMLRDPQRHKFAQIAAAELGEGGCGVWQVRPRLGLVGMLAGWWEVRLSSGCPRPA